MTSSEVRAAGGVVLRERGDGTAEVCCVHRPRYDDWSLPKGKLEGDESWEQAAVREVEEETGLRCTLGRPLPVVRYTDRRGRAKEVRYWKMTVDGAREFQPNGEVDEVRWLPLDQAPTLLSYDADRRLLDTLGDDQ
jgi:8-oxo-dGTP diphosphatase